WLLLFSSLHLYVPHRDLHSFPTRRSSDLEAVPGGDGSHVAGDGLGDDRRDAVGVRGEGGFDGGRVVVGHHDGVGGGGGGDAGRRSEEHTSELQSRENLVCRLLLEKKKQMD